MPNYRVRTRRASASTWVDRITPGQLSPRERQVLTATLDGQAEKQIAHALGISQHTVHVYAKRLHRRYGVSSRAELLSLWIAPEHRGRRPEPIQFAPGC
jgi:DNA-binding NarL/FixJ family response regulator